MVLYGNAPMAIPTKLIKIHTFFSNFWKEETPFQTSLSFPWGLVEANAEVWWQIYRRRGPPAGFREAEVLLVIFRKSWIILSCKRWKFGNGTCWEGRWVPVGFFFKGHICSEGVFRRHLQWFRDYPRTPRNVALGFLEKVNRSRIYMFAFAKCPCILACIYQRWTEAAPDFSAVHFYPIWLLLWHALSEVGWNLTQNFSLIYCSSALVLCSSTDLNIKLYKVEKWWQGTKHFCCFLGWANQMGKMARSVWQVPAAWWQTLHI